MIGKKQVLSKDISIHTNAIVRAAADLPLSYDINLTGSFYELFDLGFGYRSENAIGVNLGVQFSPTVYLGYQYEMPTNTISKITNQTHELVLKFQFERN
jgi:hypothetical protein